MSDLVLARNCCLARMLPGEAENGGRDIFGLCLSCLRSTVTGSYRLV